MDEKSFQLAGWLLAQQVSAGAQGAIPAPLVAFLDEGQERPQAALADVPSGSYEERIAAARLLLTDHAGRFDHWAFSYDTDLGISGRALFVEIGGRDLGAPLSLLQRYWLREGPELSLVGGTEILGEELLPTAVLAELAAIHWENALEAGAAGDDSVGSRWSQWRAQALDERRFRYSLGEDRFCCPKGWIARADESGGLVFYRFLSPAVTGREPVVLVRRISYPDGTTVETAVDHVCNAPSEDQRHLLEKKVFEARPSLRAGLIRWAHPGENRLSQQILVPTTAPGTFLWLLGTSRPESWEGTARACESILGSLDGPGSGSSLHRSSGIQ